MMYTAVIMDVAGSRKYADREQLQLFLKKVVEYCNRLFKKSIKKQLMFGAGDEIQGLFSDNAGAYLCVRLFMMLSYPVIIRVGIGRGNIDYDLEDWTSAELDGPAYHFARDAINISNDMDDFKIVYNSGQKKDKSINCLLFSSQLLWQNQSDICQMVKLASELIYPLYDPEKMDKLAKENELLKDILNEKTAVLKNLGSYKSDSFHLCLDTLGMDTHYISLNESFSKKSMIIEAQWKKGIATKTAAIMNTTRQNIEKHIKLGKVIENRTMDAGIVFYFMEEND